MTTISVFGWIVTLDDSASLTKARTFLCLRNSLSPKETHLNTRCYGANKFHSCKYLGPCDSLTRFIRIEIILVPIKTGTLLLYDVFGTIGNKPFTQT